VNHANVALFKEGYVVGGPGEPEATTVTVRCGDRYLVGKGALTFTDSEGRFTVADPDFATAVAIDGGSAVEFDLTAVKVPSCRMYLRPLRRIITRGSDGVPLAGVEVAQARSFGGKDRPTVVGRGVGVSDAQGIALLPDLAATEQGWVYGAIWAAPSSTPVFRPWPEWSSEPCVMDLPPLSRLVVRDVGDSRSGVLVSISGAGVHKPFRYFNNGTVTFNHVPARIQLSLHLHSPAGLAILSSRNIVTANPGRTAEVRFRDPLFPVRLTGRVAGNGPSSGVPVTLVFADAEADETPSRTEASPDGTFSTTLLSRRDPIDRDVRVSFSRAPDNSSLSSITYRTYRKRLTIPSADGSFDLGVLRHIRASPEVSGVVMDRVGRPLKNTILRFDTKACRAVSDHEPHLRLPLDVRTDDKGRFEIGGCPDTSMLSITSLSGGTCSPSELSLPVEYAEVIILNEPLYDIVVDATLVGVEGYDQPLVFEAAERLDNETDRPRIRETSTRSEPWRCAMRLPAGEWDIVAVTGLCDTVIGERRGVQVGPRTQVVAQRVVSLNKLRSIRSFFLRTSMRPIGLSDRVVWIGCHTRSIWHRDWLTENGELHFFSPNDVVDVVLDGGAWQSTMASIRAGESHIDVERGVQTIVRVRVAPLPINVQANQAWSLVVSRIGQLSGVDCQTKRDGPPGIDVESSVVFGQETILPALSSGTYRIRLVADELTYGSTEIHVGDHGRPIAVELSVNMLSVGMAAIEGYYE
jgi:hypothetical protein